MVDVEVGAEFFFDIGQVPQVATRLRWGHKFCEVSDLIQRRTPDKAQSTGASYRLTCERPPKSPYAVYHRLRRCPPGVGG